MPPVFGPVSPSPMRLKSCAGAIGTARSPSHSASSDSSSPSRNSSTSTRAPASPKRRSTKKSRSACLGLGGRLGDDHSLAGGEAVRLQHGGVGGAVHLGLRLLVRGELDPGRGRHARLAHQLLRERLAALDPRGRGRAGRTPAGPRASSASTTPATSGASGPTTVRSALLLRSPGARSRRRPRPRRRSTRASAAMPALPGAHSTSGARGLRCSARTIACSRPPPPTTRTFIARGSRRRSRRSPAPRNTNARLPLRATSPTSTP